MIATDNIIEDKELGAIQEFSWFTISSFGTEKITVFYRCEVDIETGDKWMDLYDVKIKTERKDSFASLDSLVESILNVENNIKNYQESKQYCKACSKKCSEACRHYIPKIISLEVLEEKRKELYKAYNHIHKGEIRGDGAVIEKEVING